MFDDASTTATTRTATPTVTRNPSSAPTHSSDIVNDDACFLYFGFGSNLMGDRIRLNSPSAILVGVGRLSEHRLGFTGFSDAWQGGVANIFSSEECDAMTLSDDQTLIGLEDAGGCCIWGAVWSISNQHMPCLDQQEGVSDQVYAPCAVEVDVFDCSHALPPEWSAVHASDDRSVLAELIHRIKNSRPSNQSPVQQPRCTITARAYKKVNQASSIGNATLSLPSDSYLLVLLEGAIESGLPEIYIRQLASLSTNHKISIFRDWQKHQSLKTHVVEDKKAAVV